MTLGSPVADYVHAWIDPHEAPLEESVSAARPGLDTGSLNGLPVSFSSRQASVCFIIRARWIYRRSST
jgi:hypothetical protein